MTLSEIHAGFVALRTHQEIKGYGICYNHPFLWSEELVGVLAKSWPYYSGCPQYPVDGIDKYLDEENKWTNPLRLSLLEHCIALTSNLDAFPLDEFEDALKARFSQEGKTEGLIRELLS